MSKKIASIGFDYASLDKEVAAKLQNHAGHLRKAIERFGDAGQKIGEIIWQAHEELAGTGRDGKFKTWVELEIGLSRQHAYDLMYVWERSRKCPVIGQLPPTCAYLISAPEVPEAAIEELEKQVDKGVKPTVAGVKEIIERHKDESKRGSARDRRIPAGKSASSFMGESDTVTSGSSVQLGGVTTAAPGEASSDSISEKGRPGGVSSPSSDSSPASSDPDSGEAADLSGEDERTDSTGQDAPQENDPRPPRSGTDKPEGVDYGACPNCGGKKWRAMDDRGIFCSKCHQQHGEPVGDKDEGEDHVGTMRSKTVKTAEALMRALDDLNRLSPRAGAHKQSIELCKTILKTVKGWR